MAIVGKSTTDNLFYLTVHGTTEVLSEDAVVNLLNALSALLYSDIPEPSSETKH